MDNQLLQSRRLFLAVVGIGLLLLIGVGLWWLATTSGQSVGVLLTFAAGLSMIFLPCTLPLVFVIVPLALGKKAQKGLIMALLFGLGISITLAIYGAVVSQLGGYFGLDKFSRYMFLFAGAMAILFGWSELGFIRFSPPELAGAFILTYGLWGMDWWEDSIFHKSWNEMMIRLAPPLAELEEHPVAQGAFEGPVWAGWALFLGLIMTTFIWKSFKNEEE